MGNLYTQYISRQDYRITILSKLKQLWRNYPRDMKSIHKLQEELRRYELKIRTNKKKPLKGALDKGYQSRLATAGRT